MVTIAKRIEKLGPCDEAIKWLGKRTNMKKAWAECPDAEWLMWIAIKAGVDDKLIIAAACDCAEEVLDLTIRSVEFERTLRFVRAWLDGRATVEEVWEASNASKKTLTEAYAYHDTILTYCEQNSMRAASYVGSAISETDGDWALFAVGDATIALAQSHNPEVNASPDKANLAKAEKRMSELIRKRIPFFDVAKAM